MGFDDPAASNSRKSTSGDDANFVPSGSPDLPNFFHGDLHLSLSDQSKGTSSSALGSPKGNEGAPPPHPGVAQVDVPENWQDRDARMAGQGYKRSVQLDPSTNKVINEWYHRDANHVLQLDGQNQPIPAYHKYEPVLNEKTGRPEIDPATGKPAQKLVWASKEQCGLQVMRKDVLPSVTIGDDPPAVPAAEAAAGAKPAAAVEAKPAAAVEAKPAAAVEAKPAAAVEAKPAAATGAKPAAAVEAKPAAAVDAKPAAAVEAKPAAAVETKPAAAVEAKPAAVVEAKPAAAVEAKPVAAVEAKPVADAPRDAVAKPSDGPREKYSAEKAHAEATRLAQRADELSKVDGSPTDKKDTKGLNDPKFRKELQDLIELGGGVSIAQEFADKTGPGYYVQSMEKTWQPDRGIQLQFYKPERYKDPKTGIESDKKKVCLDLEANNPVAAEAEQWARDCKAALANGKIDDPAFRQSFSDYVKKTYLEPMVASGMENLINKVGPDYRLDVKMDHGAANLKFHKVLGNGGIEQVGKAFDIQPYQEQRESADKLIAGFSGCWGNKSSLDQAMGLLQATMQKEADLAVRDKLGTMGIQKRCDALVGKINRGLTDGRIELPLNFPSDQRISYLPAVSQGFNIKY